MILALIEFYWGLYRQWSWQPDWLASKDPDSQHFHRRRYTKKYRSKLRVVRSLWFTVSLLVLAFPVMHFAVFATLFTTFLSFCILDETP